MVQGILKFNRRRFASHSPSKGNIIHYLRGTQLEISFTKAQARFNVTGNTRLFTAPVRHTAYCCCQTLIQQLQEEGEAYLDGHLD